jgi:hypothetical protein
MSDHPARMDARDAVVANHVDIAATSLTRRIVSEVSFVPARLEELVNTGCIRATITS